MADDAFAPPAVGRSIQPIPLMALANVWAVTLHIGSEG